MAKNACIGKFRYIVGANAGVADHVKLANEIECGLHLQRFGGGGLVNARRDVFTATGFFAISLYLPIFV